MVGWLMDAHPRRVVDPGCGSGRFSVAAAMRDRRLQIIAVDIDPVATLCTRAALAAVCARDVRVLQADYLACEIAPLDGRTGFVGNPPYVRHHDLSARTKSRASDLAAHAGCAVSKLAGLHAIFYLATLALHGRHGDVGSFVTSAEWLDVGYGSIVRETFVNGLGGRSLAVFDPLAAPFQGVMVTAAISTFEIGERSATVRVAHLRSTEALLRLECGRKVERNTLAQSARWSAILRDERAHDELHRIGAAFRVSRGQVTGANGYFVMSRAQARERGIEAFCAPVVASAEEVFQSGGVLRETSDRMVALEIPKGTNLAEHKKLAAYVNAGEAAGVHRRYVTSRRRPWYALTLPRPPIVATYMARQPPAFATNPDRLGVLNIAHGLYPRGRLNDESLDCVVRGLNANRDRFAGRGRTYHGGLEKFEPREMENLPLEFTG
jgi:adenine-specific DNA-methyltransferase